MMMPRPAISGLKKKSTKSQCCNHCNNVVEGVKRKEEDGSAGREDSRGTFQAISSLFSVVLRLDLSDIRWMHDSSIHTSRNVRVYALLSADMRA